MADWGQVGIVVGSWVTSAAATLGAVELTSQRQSKREAERWRAERVAASSDRRAVFEEETLIALQTAIGARARCSTEWLLHATDCLQSQRGHAGRSATECASDGGGRSR